MYEQQNYTGLISVVRETPTYHRVGDHALSVLTVGNQIISASESDSRREILSLSIPLNDCQLTFD